MNVAGRTLLCVHEILVMAKLFRLFTGIGRTCSEKRERGEERGERREVMSEGERRERREELEERELEERGVYK